MLDFIKNILRPELAETAEESQDQEADLIRMAERQREITKRVLRLEREAAIIEQRKTLR